MHFFFTQNGVSHFTWKTFWFRPLEDEEQRHATVTVIVAEVQWRRWRWWKRNRRRSHELAPLLCVVVWHCGKSFVWRHEMMSARSSTVRQRAIERRREKDARTRARRSGNPSVAKTRRQRAKHRKWMRYLFSVENLKKKKKNYFNPNQT